MKKYFLAAMAAVALTACGGSDVQPEINPAPMENTSENGSSSNEFCTFQAVPIGNVEYTMLKNVKAAKGVYGSVKDILPLFETRTKDRGGNAVVNFRSGQTFGFWPWNLVRPYAKGRAINITNTNGMTCKEMGGETMSEVLARYQ